jgi:LPXTG-motif cell wall-anchored protein
MRKTIAVAAATGALLFGGAGVAQAAPIAPAPSSTTTFMADDNNSNQDQGSDKTGLWGLVGLLGLGGLAGLKKRNDNYRGPGTTGTPGRP